MEKRICERDEGVIDGEGEGGAVIVSDTDEV